MLKMLVHLTIIALTITSHAYAEICEDFAGEDGSFLYPGDGGDYSSVSTPNTYPSNIPTDVPQDFYISSEGSTTVTIPVGAKKIFFSANDSYFADNVDPNGDYGVHIRITIIRAPQPQIN